MWWMETSGWLMPSLLHAMQHSRATFDIHAASACVGVLPFIPNPFHPQHLLQFHNMLQGALIVRGPVCPAAGVMLNQTSEPLAGSQP